LNYLELTFSESDIAQGSYREFLGGGADKWEIRGAFQLFLLSKMGLRKDNTVLDVGCGPLRAGVHLIRYLNANRYVGVDYNADFIKAAQHVIGRDASLSCKNPIISRVTDFTIPKFLECYDYILAFSVLNHCDNSQIEDFFKNIVNSCSPNTKIYISHATWYAESILSNSPLKVARTICSEKELSEELSLEDWGWPSSESIFPILEVVREASLAPQLDETPRFADSPLRPDETALPAANHGDTPSDGKRDTFIQEQLNWLSQPGNLEPRLRNLDRDRPINRIFVMGCGRSGTWLLTAMMSTFRDVAVVSDELAVEYFGILSTDMPALVLKRKFDSYLRVEQIPDCIRITYIVRHPYDVLTSHNPASGRRYHIEPHRWLGEMLSLQYLVDTQRANTKIIRYEDLVTDPEAAQASLGSFFSLKIGSSVDDIAQTFRAPALAAAAMHGIRPIDRQSVNRHKDDPGQIDYIRTIRPRLGRTLDWVAQTFDYDLFL
jgi:SAM-dependent methyltransferase